MRLGGVMHDRVMARHDPIQQLSIADIAMHELHTITEDTADVLQIPGVRQGIQHGDVHIRMMVIHITHEIRTDETTATGHNDIPRRKNFSHTPYPTRRYP